MCCPGYEFNYEPHWKFCGGWYMISSTIFSTEMVSRLWNCCIVLYSVLNKSFRIRNLHASIHNTVDYALSFKWIIERIVYFICLTRCIEKGSKTKHKSNVEQQFYSRNDTIKAFNSQLLSIRNLSLPYEDNSGFMYFLHFCRQLNVGGLCRTPVCHMLAKD